jgi:hypothetical protein
MTFRELLVTLQSFVRHNSEHQALDEHVVVVVRLQTDDEHGDELHVGGLRIATVDAGCTETFAPVLDADQDPDEPDDDPIPNILHRVLTNRTGKIRVTDIHCLCGIDPGKSSRLTLLKSIMQSEGWERQRQRFDGTLQYAYVRGTSEEREVELVLNEEDLFMKAALSP